LGCLLFQKFGIIIDLTINLFAILILFFKIVLLLPTVFSMQFIVYWNNVFKFKNVNIIEALVLTADLALTILDSYLIYLNCFCLL